MSLRWWAYVLLVVAACGCKGTDRKHAYPDDPLFVISKPVEAPAEAGLPEAVALAEPTPPAVPPLVLAARQQKANDLARRPAPGGRLLSTSHTASH